MTLPERPVISKDIYKHHGLAIKTISDVVTYSDELLKVIANDMKKEILLLKEIKGLQNELKGGH